MRDHRGSPSSHGRGSVQARRFFTEKRYGTRCYFLCLARLPSSAHNEGCAAGSVPVRGRNRKDPPSMIRTRTIGLLGGVLAALLLSPILSAEEAKTGNKPRVVLIGVSDYADKQIKPRKHAEDDAKA